MIPKIVTIAGGTVLTIFIFGACTAALTHRGTTGPATGPAPYSSIAAGPVDAAQVPPPPPPLPDPYTHNGVWLVPQDIKPGQYRVTPTKKYGGYYAVCSEVGCTLGSGISDSAYVPEPALVDIPANAVAFKISDVTLTPVTAG